MSTSFSFFVQCALGLERLLMDELVRLGLVVAPPADRPATLGGVEVRTDLQGMWAICLQSRLAENVRLRLKSFPARDFDTLQSSLHKLPFRAFLAAGTAVSLRVSCQKSKLWHSGAIAQRVGQVLEEHVQLVVRNDAPLQVFVRVADDRVQVSLDVSGVRLSQRGYREHVEKASLRESLAAALVATLDREQVQTPFLWDPFCGAGTIPLEALHAAHGLLPGARQSFAFESLRNHDAATYAEYKQALSVAAKNAAPWVELCALGSDVSERAIAAARHNTAQAGLADWVRWQSGDVRQVIDDVPPGAFVLTNPPYGKRLATPSKKGAKGGSGGRVHPAVFHLLSALETRPDLRPVVALVGGDTRKALPKNAPALFRTKNGGLPVSARLLAGQQRLTPSS